MPDAVPDPAAAQPVVSPLTTAALILVVTIEPGGDAAVREVLPDLGAFARSIDFRFPGTDLACVTGFGSDAWDRLFAGPRRPASIRSRSCAAPATTRPPPPAICCSTSGASGWTCATSGPPG